MARLCPRYRWTERGPGTMSGVPVADWEKLLQLITDYMATDRIMKVGADFDPHRKLLADLKAGIGVTVHKNGIVTAKAPDTYVFIHILCTSASMALHDEEDKLPEEERLAYRQPRRGQLQRIRVIINMLDADADKDRIAKYCSDDKKSYRELSKWQITRRHNEAKGNRKFRINLDDIIAEAIASRQKATA